MAEGRGASSSVRRPSRAVALKVVSQIVLEAIQREAGRMAKAQPAMRPARAAPSLEPASTSKRQHREETSAWPV